jgi:hypothetical protein
MSRPRLHVVRGVVICTTHDRPPIPTAAMDWCAFVDGEEELGEYGYGATEAEAIEQLMELLEVST